MTVYDRIRILREKNGLSQQELANRVGFKTASAINKIELGLRDISQTKLSEFAKALSTTPGYLMGWDTAETPAPEQEVLTVHERAVLTAYRAKPEMQKAVDTLLGVAEEPPAIADDMKDTVALGEAVFGKARTAAK